MKAPLVLVSQDGTHLRLGALARFEAIHLDRAQLYELVNVNEHVTARTSGVGESGENTFKRSIQ